MEVVGSGTWCWFAVPPPPLFLPFFFCGVYFNVVEVDRRRKEALERIEDGKRANVAPVEYERLTERDGRDTERQKGVSLSFSGLGLCCYLAG